MQMLVQTLPESLDDLTVQVALVRPGPILGGAVHPYIERRKLLRADPGYEVPYEHPSLEPVLRDTLGTIVFQDQVIETSMAFAGFSRGRGRGAAPRDEPAALRGGDARLRAEVHRGRVSRTGRRSESAERVYAQIVGFSGFGFPKAHSAAFGLLAYQSAWLREHYGPEFLCGLLNEQPMGFYPPDSLVHEAQRRKLEILPADVLASDVLCKVERRGRRARGAASGSGTCSAFARRTSAESSRSGSEAVRSSRWPTWRRAAPRSRMRSRSSPGRARATRSARAGGRRCGCWECRRPACP